VVSLGGKYGVEARLLMATHAQTYFEKPGVLYGSPEEVFKNAVAREMIGLGIDGYTIPAARRAEAEALKVLWEPKLRAIGGNPLRPQLRHGVPSQPGRRVSRAPA
jgi:hypothetical protein